MHAPPLPRYSQDTKGLRPHRGLNLCRCMRGSLSKIQRFLHFVCLSPPPLDWRPRRRRRRRPHETVGWGGRSPRGTGGTRKYLQDVSVAAGEAACEQLVLATEPAANGAMWAKGGPEVLKCFAQFSMTGVIVSESANYRTCTLKKGLGANGTRGTAAAMVVSDRRVRCGGEPAHLMFASPPSANASLPSRQHSGFLCGRCIVFVLLHAGCSSCDVAAV